MSWYFQSQRINCIGEYLPLSQFYESYQIEEIAERMKQFEDSFPFYRKIKGDGNCFYRAFAFLYIRNTKSMSFEQVFPKVPFICVNYPLERKSSEELYYDLQHYWERSIRDIICTNDIKAKQRKIERLFNEGEGSFDTLIIGYLRSANAKNLNQKKSQFINYVVDEREEWETQIGKTCTFNEYIQNIQIYSLVDFFKVGLTIIEVTKSSVHPIYFDKYDMKGFCMILRNEHYEIIYPVTSDVLSSLENKIPRRAEEILLAKKKQKMTPLPQPMQKGYFSNFGRWRQEEKIENKRDQNQSFKPYLQPGQNNIFEETTRIKEKQRYQGFGVHQNRKINSIKIPQNTYLVKDGNQFFEKVKVEAMGIGLIAFLIYFLI